MVLTQLFQRIGIRNDAVQLLFSGFFYALLGIAIARVIFSNNIGLVAVFLISIALIPTIHDRLSKKKFHGFQLPEKENRTLASVGKWELNELMENYRSVFQAYTFTFFGVFMAFALIALFLSGGEVRQLFGDQLNAIGSAGAPDFFTQVIVNNLGVLLIAFAISLLFKYGITFIVTWNASVWGTVFALQSIQFASTHQLNPLVQFALIMIVVFPHTIAEAAAYFSAAISGGILNKAFTQQKWWGNTFNQYSEHAAIMLLLGVALVVLASAIESVVAIVFFS